jgi:hypothetical protein
MYAGRHLYEDAGSCSCVTPTGISSEQEFHDRGDGLSTLTIQSDLKVRLSLFVFSRKRKPVCRVTWFFYDFFIHTRKNASRQRATVFRLFAPLWIAALNCSPLNCSLLTDLSQILVGFTTKCQGGILSY